MEMTEAGIPYVREDEVRRILTMADALACVEAAMTDRALGKAQDVPRTIARYAAGNLRILSSASTAGWVGYKATFQAAGGFTRGCMNMIDAATGELRGIVESLHLSVIRTGAASGIATRALARPDARRVGMIGTGSQAIGQLQAVCAVRPIEAAAVYGRDATRLREFCDRAQALLRIPVLPVASAAEAVRGADIVNVITSSAVPVLQGAWLAPGQHINAAGSNAHNRRELDGDAVRRSDLIVVDSRDVARSECGDLLPFVEHGELDWEGLPELGEVLTGQSPGRSGRDQVTVYESHGMGVQDLYCARFVLDAIGAIQAS
jgi:ornithine cyclodeaminase